MKYLMCASFLILPVMVFTLHLQIDCIDEKRKLRCVIKGNCPARRLENSKNCPAGRVCCRKHKSNPYLPLRKVTNSTILSLLDIRNRANQDNDRLVFPSELENINFVTTTPTFDSIKINKKKENEKNSRESKSDNNMNFIYGVVNRPQRSVLECERYSKLHSEYSHFMPLLPDATPKKITMANCKPQINPLIVGGKNASIKNYPHMAALGYKKYDDTDYLCGGTLISENFVLTAGHCANTRWGPPVIVHLGSAELYSNEAVTTAIKQVIVHPNYKPPSCYNDIALLKLKHSLRLSLSVRPACLPTTHTEMQSQNYVVVATGWGKTGFGRDSSMTLLKVPLKLIKNQECGKYYEGDTRSQALRNGITSNMLCASGFQDAHQDTCQGDSGGPLQAPLLEHECMSQVVGITSFGKSCGAGIPAVYTRVLPYTSWIENIVWPL